MSRKAHGVSYALNETRKIEETTELPTRTATRARPSSMVGHTEYMMQRIQGNPRAKEHQKGRRSMTEQ